MNTKLKRGFAHFLLGLCLIPLTSFGHHSFLGRFDTESIVELQGEVTEVYWRNPHAVLILTVEDDRGQRVPWEIETNAPTSLVRLGITADLIKSGRFRPGGPDSGQGPPRPKGCDRRGRRG